MKPKKLRQEQFHMVKESNEKHNLFTFDHVKPYYYVIDHVFSDSKKGMLVYFDEEDKKLVWMEDLKDEQDMNTKKVEKWIKNYHKKKKPETQKRQSKTSKLEKTEKKAKRKKAVKSKK